jgi:hypothetical protein
MLPPPTLEMRSAFALPKAWWKQEDTHLFVLSFCAFFVVFSVFIA